MSLGLSRIVAVENFQHIATLCRRLYVWIAVFILDQNVKVLIIIAIQSLTALHLHRHLVSYIQCYCYVSQIS